MHFSFRSCASDVCVCVGVLRVSLCVFYKKLSDLHTSDVSQSLAAVCRCLVSVRGNVCVCVCVCVSSCVRVF
jgi:hypothetical protein